MKKVKEKEPNQIGKEKAYYKLFTSVQNSVFYFENPDTKKTIELKFDLELENLGFPGEPNKKSF